MNLRAWNWAEGLNKCHGTSSVVTKCTRSIMRPRGSRASGYSVSSTKPNMWEVASFRAHFKGHCGLWKCPLVNRLLRHVSTLSPTQLLNRCPAKVLKKSSIQTFKLFYCELLSVELQFDASYVNLFHVNFLVKNHNWHVTTISEFMSDVQWVSLLASRCTKMKF